MKPETLATLLSIAIAIFALLPAERKFDYQIKLSAIDYFVVLAALGLIHYINFYPVLASFGVAPFLGAWRYQLNDERASYLLFLTASVFISLRLSVATLRRRRTPEFRGLMEELIHQGNHSHAIYLLRKNLAQLARIAANDFPVQRLRKVLAPNRFLDFDKPPRKEIVDKLCRAIARTLPSYANTQSEAREIFRLALSREPMARSIALNNPYLGVEILSLRPPYYTDFQEQFLQALLSDRHSVLYGEIENSQNMADQSRYSILEHNRIISFYFGQTFTAERLEVYKPLGEFVGELFDKYHVQAERDPYNSPLANFHESSRWKDPVHAVLRLFDIMVREALFRNVEWHMWLYYYPTFANKILRNLRPSTFVDHHAEWPTPYHYFLYEMISQLGDWIEAATELDPNQANVLVESTGLNHENGNIPKSAALALGSILHSALINGELSGEFKTYLVEVALRRYEAVAEKSGFEKLQKVVISSIANGSFHRTSRPLYQANLLLALQSADVMLRVDHEDELQQAMITT